MPNQIPSSPLDDRRAGTAEFYDTEQIELRASELPRDQESREVQEATLRAMAAYGPREIEQGTQNAEIYADRQSATTEFIATEREKTVEEIVELVNTRGRNLVAVRKNELTLGA